MNDKVLAEKQWSHVLFQRGNTYLLTMISGGPVQVDHTVQLPEALALGVASQPQQMQALVQECLSGSLPPGVLSHAAPVWPAA